ncbi:ribosomal protein S6 kinase alpha-2-like [Mantella aurantiaca]
MAAGIMDETQSTAQAVLQIITKTSDSLTMMEVEDHFDPVRELGAGSYGKVLLARHRNSGQFVALKMLNKEKVQKENFLLEYGTSRNLSFHPSIILTHEIAFHTSRNYVFVQEVATAGSLQSMVKPMVGLNEDLVKRCVPQIASALEFIHSKGLVHRDIKLDNILVMDSECHVIKVADYGLTRLQGTYTPPMSWVIPYTAPELCSLKPEELLLLHPSIDVWAFGVLVYTALTGSFPWNGAESHDHMYRDFVWWKMRKDLSLAPGKWREFTLEARQMFWDMLALNAPERCSARDIVKYVNLPWKPEIPPENNLTRNTDNMAAAAQNVRAILDGMVSSSSQGLKQLDLKDHFVIVKELGEGGFGKVLLANDRKTGQMALKVLNKMRTTQHSFLLEFSISYILSSHPNIIGCFGSAFTTRDEFVFIQELAPVGDLLSMITPYVGIQEVMVKRCAVQISRALEFIADKGLVHMDLKPENVLVFDKECQKIKLTDFGLARVKGTLIRGRVGTYSYMSPEMCKTTNSDGLTAESTLDVWAFGVVLYCLLTGNFPWEEAVADDEEYKSFADWQNSFQTENPQPWNKIPTGILKMFGDLLAIDCTKRCRASEVLKYMRESWKETPGSFRNQEVENPMENRPAVQHDKPECEASQLKTQNTLETSQSNISIISSYRSTSYRLTIDTSRSQSEMSPEPQEGDVPETEIMFDDEFSLHVGAEVDIG